ncbi:MAG: RNA methyltransferase [Rhodocyclaceae bacterium]
MKRITSRENAHFKWWRQLADSGRERRRQGKTVLDGAHLLEAYLSRVGVPSALAISDQGFTRPEICRLVDQCAGCEMSQFSDALFADISPVDTPTGLLSAIDIPAAPVNPRIDGSCVVLDGVQDAGNVGSILRSTAAGGVKWALFSPGCAQAWSPKVLRAAMGAHFSLKLVEAVDVASVLGRYTGRIIATKPDASADLFGLDIAGPVAWLFGSEGGGLSPELLDLATDLVRIPMAGATESLNVAAAAAICLFEAVRQADARTRAGGP